MKELSIILNLILVLLLTSNTLSYIPLKEEDVNSHTIQNTNINTDSLESDTKLENFSKKGSKTKSKGTSLKYKIQNLIFRKRTKCRINNRR